MSSTGSFMLKNGYKITGVIYHSMGDNYISYIVGFIIKGPKNGTYVIDNFGIQRLRTKVNMTLQQGIGCRILDTQGNVKVDSKCIVRNAAIMKGRTDEECASNYAKSCGYTFIKRNKVNEFISKAAD